MTFIMCGLMAGCFAAGAIWWRGAALVPQAHRWRWLFVGIAVMNLIAAMTSGQRALFLPLPVALLVISVVLGFRFRRTFLSAGLAFTGVTLTLLLTGTFVIDRSRSLSDDPTYSLVAPYTDAIRGNFAEEFAEKGVQRSRVFSWERNAQRTREVCDSLLRHGRRRDG